MLYIYTVVKVDFAIDMSKSKRVEGTIDCRTL